MEDQQPSSSSLALALSGFDVSPATAHSLLPQRRGARHSKLRTAITTSLTPLIKHAQVLGAQLVSASSQGSQHQLIEQLESLCFALRSTLGLNGQLPQEEEGQIWQLSMQLWEAGLDRPASQAEPLAKLAKELFELLEDECDKSEECAALVSFFAKMAGAWAKLGNREQAGWCIERAMRYSEQLETMLRSDEVPRSSQESAVVRLFSLYIEATRNATDTRQKALANNLMSRAVQLSRHYAVSPDSSVSMCLSITQLQLQQAQAMGETETMLAAALLTAAYQHLTAAEQPAAESTSAQLQEGVKQLKQEVVLQLCKAHLQAGDAMMAAKCMENLDASAASDLAPDAQLMVVRVNVEAGRLAEALQFLVSMLAGVDLSSEGAAPSVHTWLACLKLALPVATEETLPAFQSAVTTYIWKSTRTPQFLLLLLKTLLSIDQGYARQGCRKMALEMLANDELTISIYKDGKMQQEVHAVLWHTAVQLFSSCDAAAARELFSAAFQYAKPASRPKNARMLSACHTRLNQHERAAEYLDIAAREEQQPSYATQLMRVQAFVKLRRHAEAVEALKSLPACPDFHTSCVGIACAAASQAEDSTVAKEAAAMAVKVLIKPDIPDSSVAAGEEGRLLLEYTSAVQLCIQHSAGGKEVATLYKELASAIRLATKHLAVVTANHFAGEDKVALLDALGRHAYNGGLQAYRAGALEACVMLLSSSCMLLKEKPSQQHSEGIVAQQARALMAATQALLDLHASGSGADRTGRLLLAQKLLSKVQELVEVLPAGLHADLRQCYAVLATMVGSQLHEEGPMVEALEELFQCSTPVPVSRYRAILGLQSSRRQHSDRLRAALYSLASRCVQQAGSAAEGLGLAATLLQTCPSPGHMRHLLQACCRLLERCSTAAASVTAAPGPSQEERALRQWLVCQAWNRGVELGKVPQMEEAEALLQLALDMLHAGGLPAELAQAQRLERALAPWRAVRPQAAAAPAFQGSLPPADASQQVSLSMPCPPAAAPGLPPSADLPEEPAAASQPDSAMALDSVQEQQAPEPEFAAASILQAAAEAASPAGEEVAIAEHLSAATANLPSAAADPQVDTAAGTSSVPADRLSTLPAGSFNFPALSRLGPSNSQQTDDEESQGSPGAGPSWLNAIDAAQKLCDDKQLAARQQQQLPARREPPIQQLRHVKRQALVTLGRSATAAPARPGERGGGQAAAPEQRRQQGERASELIPTHAPDATAASALQKADPGTAPALAGEGKNSEGDQAASLPGRQGGDGVEELSIEDDDTMGLD